MQGAVVPKVEEGVAGMLGCVPSAAKSAGAPPPAKKQRNSDAYAINNAQSWCKRVSEGKQRNATGEQVEAAKVGRALFMSGDMCHDQKKDFAHKMAESCKTKTYGWVKTFQSSWKVSRKETEEVTQNYFTRTMFAMHTCFTYIYIYIHIYIFLYARVPMHEYCSIGAM